MKNLATSNCDPLQARNPDRVVEADNGSNHFFAIFLPQNCLINALLRIFNMQGLATL